MSSNKKSVVAILGSGSWGSALAALIATNSPKVSSVQEQVTLWVFDEDVNGERLSEIVNKTHTNPKYLPNYDLPPNLYAEPNLNNAVKDADYIVLALPIQMVEPVCEKIVGKTKSSAVVLSAVKSFTARDKKSGGGIRLVSEIVDEVLKCPCGVLTGANVAHDIAEEQYCETNLSFPKGYNDDAQIFRSLLQQDYFRVVVIDAQVKTLEVCSGLKNVVAFAAGFVDGRFHPYQSNTKVALLRLGMMEAIRFCSTYYPESRKETYWHTAVFGDLVSSCYAGRNRRIGEAFAKNWTNSVRDYETELLGGRSVQGPLVSETVKQFLADKRKVDEYPILVGVSRLVEREMHPDKFVDTVLKNHPDQV